jgi:trimeric autotransporter adhesin
MSIENEIAGLTQSTTDLLEAVNTKKATLDTAVSNAQTAVTDATSQVSLAAAEKVGAQTARDTAETFKDQAYTYSQSAASAVAYQDLTAIAQTKAETAVDVFVYDTSKDSDGGAWRQRTQGTSWYNEPLNTSTRGSRKEFPAVAVIVAEIAKVTIYDGDDPSLPMWMVFSSGAEQSSPPSINALGGGAETSLSCTALNGIIVIGNNSTALSACVLKWDFIADLFSNYTAYYIWGGTAGNIANRAVIHSLSQDLPVIVNAAVNDVAMTVLPDAPIDPATGLPIPTIAVATDGGVSVIKDDGTVVDIASTGVDYNYVTQCAFYGERLAFMLSYKGIAADGFYHIVDIPSTDISMLYSSPVSSLNGEYYYKTVTNSIPTLPSTSTFGNNLENTHITEKAIGGDYGFAPFDRLPENQEQGSIAYITSEYNTGWMNGDIKLATLSDTDDTDLVGSELVTNGTFDDTSNWSITFASPSSGISGGQAFIESSGSNAKIQQSLTLVEGKTYVFEFDLVSEFGSGLAYVRLGSTDLIPASSALLGKNTVTFVAGSSGTLNFMTFANAGASFTIDNISVRLAEADRSVNNNGLQVFGTVQKSPVATGADLVAYSGFTGYNVSANYLKQPYNSDLDFGTGDFCVMGWFKNGSGYLFDRTDSGDLGSRIRGFCTSSAIQFITEGGTININKDYTDGSWHLYCGLKKDGVLYLYVDSVLIGTASCASNLDNANAYLVLGNRYDFNAPIIDASLALWRISGTAPTAEQIKKIYEDEKVLFQENAKATLHGTSDAVTALAYDDTTELLHVGTSAGRSVFKGLRRVDNTTDAVGVAISASNGLVVEE